MSMFQLLMVYKNEFHKGKLTNAVQVCKVDVSSPPHQLVVRALRLGQVMYIHERKIGELSHTSLISLGATEPDLHNCSLSHMN